MTSNSKNYDNWRDDSSSSDSDSEKRDPNFGPSSFRGRKRNGNVLPRRKRNGNSSCVKSASSPISNTQKEEVIVIPKKARSKRPRPVLVPIRRENVPQAYDVMEWLINDNILRENETVQYLDKSTNRATKSGLITRNGINCLCCKEYFEIGEFQVHGGGKMDDENIFVVEKGVYLSCLMDSDLHDDACMICADGGDLMCCESCPSTYHYTCMGLEAIPEGTWYCPYCVCKFCLKPASEGDSLVACLQCKMRYHLDCRWRDLINIDLNRNSCESFCKNSCEEENEKIQRIIGTNIELEGGFRWCLLKRLDEDNYRPRMHVLNHFTRNLCNFNIEIVWKIMKESFEPIIDRHTQIDILKSVVFNNYSIFNRIDFENFYIAILEKDYQIVSAACIRIHKNKIAEMPFIATRETCRGKGFCSKLLGLIESTLCGLKVEYLVIPSTEERVGGWIRRHEFGPVDQNLKKLLMNCNTLMFHDSIRLQKTLFSQKTGTANSEVETSKCQTPRVGRIGFSFV